MQSGIRNVVGLPVSGSNYFGYVPEYKRIWAEITSGADVLLFGPRRSGKTSLLYRIRESAPEREWNVIFVNTCSITSPTEFVSSLYREAKALPSAESALTSAARKIKEGIQGISKAEVSLTGLKLEFNKGGDKEWDWKMAGEILLSSLSSLDDPVLIILDEFGYFLHSLTADESPAFLQWFMAIRQNYDTYSRIRWLATSEVRVDFLLRQLSSPYALQDFRHLTLGPLDRKTADELLYALTTSVGLNANRTVREYILNKIGETFPFYIQAFVSSLNDVAENPEIEITEDLVNLALDRLLNHRTRILFPMVAQNLFSQVGTRLSELARSILIHLSTMPEGLSFDDLHVWIQSNYGNEKYSDDDLKIVLDILLQESVLITENDRIQIRANIFREYFLRQAA